MIEINKLVRSKRKTLALIVETDGKLTVRAPLGMKDADIRIFVKEKEKWIKRKQAQSRVDAIRPRTYEEGETFPYLGREYPLRIVQSRSPTLVLDSSFRLTKAAAENAELVFVA